jgi:hypothetical protein
MHHYQNHLCTAALLVPLCSSAFAECSLNTVRGIWGVQVQGTAIVQGTPVPFASLGVATFDHQGRYLMPGKISVAGQIHTFAVPGSIQVNPDCTGTDTYAEGTDRFVILDNGNEMHWMPTKHSLGPVAGRAIFRRIAHSQWNAPCTTDMLRGLYGGTAQGTVMIVPPGQEQRMPVPYSGIITGRFQPGAAPTVTSTASLAGNIVDFEFPTFSYRVNPDCTAIGEWTAVSKDMPPVSGTTMWVVLDGGKELLGLETSNTAGPGVVIQNLKRISIAADR